MGYVRYAPKSVEVTKIRIRNVAFYIIKRAENSIGFIFEAESLLFNVDFKAENGA